MGNQHSSDRDRSSTHNSNSTTRTRSSTVTTQPDALLPSLVIDGGFTDPQSHLYASAAAAYSRPTVHKLIQDRRLAPYYLGLNDWEEDWDVPQLVEALIEAEEQATKNLHDALNAASEQAAEAEAALLTIPPATRKSKEGQQALAAAVLHRERLQELISQREKKGGGGLQWSSKTEQAKRYHGTAEECPICFLYYPARTMHTRCCDQPICTECFVQIKRAEPTPTHLESEPAACPFCMEPNFGCFYAFQQERAAAAQRPTLAAGGAQNNSAISGVSVTSTSSAETQTPPPVAAPKPRRKSFAHTDREVVTTDQLHPDWEAKLEAMKATVARRSNRRIVFRQVGDRLIPVGVTSGRAGDGANATMSTTQLPPGFMAQVAAALDANNNAGASGGSSGRRAARRRNEEMARYLESMGIGVGQDLEEMMVMEAMRMSMQEEEERKKKMDAEEAAKQAAAGGASPPAGAAAPEASTSRSSSVNASLLSDAMGAPIGSSNTPSPAPVSTAVLDGAPPVVPVRGSSASPNATHRASAIPSAPSSPSPLAKPTPTPSSSSAEPAPTASASTAPPQLAPIALSTPLGESTTNGTSVFTSSALDLLESNADGPAKAATEAEPVAPQAEGPLIDI